MKKLLLAVALFSAAPAFSAQTCTIHDLPKITGLDYHTARGKLINAGFLPVPQPAKQTDDPRSSDYASASALGYIELAECAPTGYARCYFVFSHNGKEITVSLDASPSSIWGTVAAVKCQ